MMEKLRDKKITKLLEKGKKHASRGDFKNAVKFFDKALKIDPNSELALYLMGRTLYFQNKYEESSYYLDKVLEINPDCYHASYHKGFNLMDLNKYEEAVACFDELLHTIPEKYPKYYLSLNAKGVCIFKIPGREEEGIFWIKKFLKEVPPESGYGVVVQSANELVDEFNVFKQRNMYLNNNSGNKPILRSAIICSICETKNSKEAKFCRGCGDELMKDDSLKNIENKPKVHGIPPNLDVKKLETIKKAKELLDIEAISEEEFEKIKNNYLKEIK